MKITVVSDIHGNLQALNAVLRHARGRNAADVILNLGDATGYGPNPEEVVRWSQGIAVVNIVGNYDKKVISKQHRKTDWAAVKTPEKRAMFEWTHKALSKQSHRFLKSLPESQETTIGGVRLLMTHGSPASHTEHLRPDTPQKRLSELADSVDASVVLCGHSHRSFCLSANRVMFVNPGSVGRPDDGDPRASYAVLEIRDGTVSTQLYRVPYHITPVVHALQQTGLPLVFSEVIRQGLNYDDVVEELGKFPVSNYLEPNGAVSLLTDFGLKDHFIGVMKGVIIDIAPHVELIDISHQIQPQNITQAARMLAEAVPYFSPGTVHVAVVDPGVGTDRRAVAARIGQHFFVVPDNGLLTPLLNAARANQQPIQIINLNQPQYWLPEPSRSFHGRDIFAPIGAHLANGVPLEKLGPSIDDPVTVKLPHPTRTSGGWLAEVVMVDVFGNLSTNLSAEVLPNDYTTITVKIKGVTIHGLTLTFAEAPPNQLIATVDSTGTLAISVVNGNAAQQLECDIGTPVEVLV